MPFLELFDETLDINSTENYELSIQAGPDGLSFCLLDSIRNKFIMIRSFGAEENKYFNSGKISELLKEDDFLTRRYKKVKYILPSSKFTLVPAPLYDPGKKVEYFTFNHNLEDDNVVLADKTADPDSFLVYSVSKSISEVMSNAYPGIHPHHQIKLLLDHTSASRKSLIGNYIHVHVERDFFNLIVFDYSILKFCNSFSYRNISDILYYVLNAFKKLDIKQEEAIYFSGLTEKYDDLSSSFSLYIRNIKFAEPSGNFTFSYVFNDMELHRFINLFNVVNCE
jgi:Protein of unknown function (DUF3822)